MFDSASFSTDSFSANSFDFGEIVPPDGTQRTTYGGFIPEKKPFKKLPTKLQIARDDDEILALVVAAIESGVIQ